MTTAEIRSHVGDIVTELSSLALHEPEFAKEHATYHDSLERLATIVLDLSERLDASELESRDFTLRQCVS